MKPLSEYRSLARHTLKSKWGNAALLTLILFIITNLSGILAALPLHFDEDALIFELLHPLYNVCIILPSIFVFTCVFLRLILRPETQPVYSFFRKFPKNYGRGFIGMLLFVIAISAIVIASLIVSIVVALLIFSAFGHEADLDTLSDIRSLYAVKALLSSSTTILFILVSIGLALLLMAPAYIYYYSLILFPYVIQEEPDCEVRYAYARSRKLMSGRKWRLFLLDLSFIGWDLLSLLTCGIGYLFVMPYREVAHAHFYLDAKREYEETHYNTTE